MNEIHTSRFKDAPWFAKEEINTVIGGAGGIGSWLTLLLCRAGFTPVVYDFDRLEEHNLAGQMYSKQDAISNKLKVTALKENCKAFADTDINIFSERITEETMSHNYVFSAFDNMKARKDMFGAWKVFVEDWKRSLETEEVEGPLIDSYKTTPIFIDGRLRAEQMQIFCVTPNNIEAYEAHLFDDTEVEDAPCTLKQTSHSAAMIASHMVAFFTNHLTNNNAKDIERNVPFLWEYFIPLDYLTVE